MENENAPVDPAAAAEANAIVRDPNHPKHGIFHNPGHHQNREVSALVESLYQKAWPGMKSLDDGVTLVDEASAQAVPPVPQAVNPGEIAEPPMSPEARAQAAQAVNAEAVAELQRVHGDRAPAVVARAQSVAAYLKSDQPMFERMVDLALQKGVSLAVMTEILNEVGEQFGFADKR